ncbi:universal stress protein [Pacificoceanicola onchidii]|uniref:universal stress protein n=1 Tax=Pacificoceanicola onchidii TaxID=2562685 RepID=UPI0010A2AE36|nr:universal stress protein [Pacificoceanicola onchidii]
MYTNILVPIAFDEGSDEKVKAALALAGRLAEEGAKITLLHVMEKVPGYAVSYLPADYTAQSRAAIASELNDLASAIPGGEGLVIEGHSGRTILDWAEENGSDLIVISSHRPGMQDLLLGSTATQVVRHASCAVHVLR